MSATVVSLYVVRGLDGALLGHFTTSVKAKTALKKAGISSPMSSGPGTVPAIRTGFGSDAVYYLLADARPIPVNGRRTEADLLASARAKLDPDEYEALSNHLGGDER